MIRPMIRPMIRSMIRVYKRWFTKLNGTSYYTVAEMELGGDFTISFNIKGSNVSVDQAIFDSATFQTIAGDVLIYLDIPDGLQLAVGTGGGFNRYVIGGLSEILNGEDNRVVITRVGASLITSINGVAFGSPIAITTSMLALTGGMGGGNGRNLDGYLYDMEVTGITNAATYPSGTANWKLDEQGSATGYLYQDSANAGTSTQATGFNIAPEDEFYGDSPE